MFLSRVNRERWWEEVQKLSALASQITHREDSMSSTKPRMQD